jgi:hypothetical protein
MKKLIKADIDREKYNCEISGHIMERIREETVLVKEKVKEIHKVVQELDRKMKTARILEVYAKHSKEEVYNERDEL